MPPDSTGAEPRRQLRFTPRPEDMVAAQRCSYLSRLFRRSSLVALAVIFLVLGLFIHIAMPDAPWYWTIGVFLGAVLGGIGGGLASRLWYVPRASRRVFRQQRTLHNEFVVSWDENEMHHAWAKGESRIAFKDYLRWAESRDVILLYQAENLFQFLPKRVLDPSQVDDLRAIARQAGVPGTARGHRRAR